MTDARAVDSPRRAPIVRSRSGVLPDRAIHALIDAGHVRLGRDRVSLVQPASLDLRLGAQIYRVRASFLPGRGIGVLERVAELDGHAISLDTVEPTILEPGAVYVARIEEALRLPPELRASANPKSSTGRLDILTRLITDGGTAFDRVEAGYGGELYVEIAPRAFGIAVRRDTSVNQLRFGRGDPTIGTTALQRLVDSGRILRTRRAPVVRDGRVAVTVDLSGTGRASVVGYRAKKNAGRVDLDRRDYDARDFWDPILRPRSGRLIVDPGEFYILVSREIVDVPVDRATEMIAYDPATGAFRPHLAGFLDPGFRGRAVLELRSHEVPFALEHGQIIAWLSVERMQGDPDCPYGDQRLRSHYQGQGLALGKHFGGTGREEAR